MTDRLRQRLYSHKDFGDLVYSAVLGKFSKDEYSEADGSYPDISYKIIFGDTPVLSADTATEIWPNTAGDMEFPTAAETLSIVSSSTQDDAGGTGVDAVFVEGLDSDYLPQSELIFLDGTTPATSTNTFVHVSEINCLNITTSGSSNVGSISITNSSSGDRMGYVEATDAISEHGQFVVPAGYSALILDMYTSAFKDGGTKAARKAELDIIFEPLDGGAGDRIRYKTLKTGVGDTGITGESFTAPLVVGPKVAIIPVATTDTANTRVAVQYDLLLIRETVDIDSIF